MLFYWKCAATLVVAVWIYVMARQIKTGRKLTTLGPGTGVIYGRLVSDHRSLAKAAMCIAGIAIFAIEIMIHMLGYDPGSVNPVLYWTNIASGLLWLGLFLLIFFRFNGTDYPRLHRKLVYVSTFLFVVALATGVPMLVSLSV